MWLSYRQRLYKLIEDKPKHVFFISLLLVYRHEINVFLWFFILHIFEIIFKNSFYYFISEGSTLAPEPDIIVNHPHGSHFISRNEEHDKDVNWLSEEERGRDNPGLDRFNHSRMLTLSTTLGYDEWWFLTTKRPGFSLKDFPGRPGGKC